MKKITALVLICALALSMAAIGVAEERVKLRFMWWGGDARHEATLAVIDRYMEENPNVIIEPEFGGSDGYLEKLSTQLYSGTAADLIQCGTGWMPDFMNKGDFFVDFNAYADKIDLSGFEADYLRNTGYYNDMQVGLPSGIASNVMLVNTTLADELGIDLSEQLTWDSLIELAKQVQEVDSSKYLLNADAPTINLELVRPYIMQLTGRPFIDDDTQAVSFTREQLIQVLDYIKTLYDVKAFQPAEESAPFRNALNTNPKWVNGDFVMAYCVSSTITPLTDAAPDYAYDVVQVPLMEGRLDDGFYANPPQLMAISNTSANIDVCVDFYNYFFNSEEAAEILKDVRSVPAVASARELCVEKGYILPIVEKGVNLSLELNGTNEMGLTTSAEVEAVILDMIENVAYGTRSTEEIADETIALLEGILANQ